MDRFGGNDEVFTLAHFLKAHGVSGLNVGYRYPNELFRQVQLPDGPMAVVGIGHSGG